MSDLQARSFIQLVRRDFADTADPPLPYADDDTTARLVAFRRPPADMAATTNVLGSVDGQYKVFRTVDWVVDVVDPPPNPPGAEADMVRALELEVLVLWIDDTDPAFPIDEAVGIDDLQASWAADPSRPWVGYVRLRTVRVNDAASNP
jgi:hypothetical protein